MDRETLLRQLAQAQQQVAEGKAFIAKQQRLIPNPRAALRSMV